MKNVIEMLEKHPAVRFGLPVLAIVACTLLFLFGISYFSSIYTYIAISVILLVTGDLIFCRRPSRLPGAAFLRRELQQGPARRQSPG